MHRLSSVNSFFFPGASDGNESDCASNPYMYAAAFANQFGPTDLGTVKCLFTLAFSSDSGKTKENETLYLGVPVAGTDPGTRLRGPEPPLGPKKKFFSK